MELKVKLFTITPIPSELAGKTQGENVKLEYSVIFELFWGQQY
jgi:hypothetical protein